MKANKKQLAKTNDQNFLMFISAFLVLALGFMSYIIYNKPTTKDPLDSDNLETIETNLNDTDLTVLDQSLLQFEKDIK